jgi:hypothetical protein
VPRLSHDRVTAEYAPTRRCFPCRFSAEYSKAPDGSAVAIDDPQAKRSQRTIYCLFINLVVINPILVAKNYRTRNNFTDCSSCVSFCEIGKNISGARR